MHLLDIVGVTQYTSIMKLLLFSWKSYPTHFMKYRPRDSELWKFGGIKKYTGHSYVSDMAGITRCLTTT